jgi:fused signal recognition particle receptor
VSESGENNENKKKRRWFSRKEQPNQEVASQEETPLQEEVPLEEAPSEVPPLESPPLEVTPLENLEETEDKRSFFQRMKQGLSRSSSSISGSVTGIFTKAKLDSETLQELEDVLISADLGVETTRTITAKLTKERFDKEISPQEIKTFVASEVSAILTPLTAPFKVVPGHRPHVVLVVGVNGAGKTTTIGKMAHLAAKAGHKVMLAAGDTFRAAAIEQLKIWGTRVGAPVVARDVGSDAASLAFDALKEAQESATDILFIDTAGRLQNKVELMAELEKIGRVIKKLDDTAPHSVLLVLDATTGQNALNQVKVFSEISGVTGLVMTKLDGTARGGILVAVAAKHGLPIHAIGVGEAIEDFQPFDADEFAKALVGLDSEPQDPAQ